MLSNIPEGEGLGYQIGEDEDPMVFYFANYDQESGKELWKWDVFNEKKPRLLMDIYPGNNDAGNVHSSNPNRFIIFKEKLYFRAQSDSTNSFDIWFLDEENPPSKLCINKPAFRNPRKFVVWNDCLYFIAEGSEINGNKQNEFLYCYDGIKPPYRAPNINPGIPCYPLEDLIPNDTLLISHTEPENKMPVFWSYDGINVPEEYKKLNVYKISEMFPVNQDVESEVPIKSQIPTRGLPSKFTCYPNAQVPKPRSTWLCWRWNGSDKAKIEIRIASKRKPNPNPATIYSTEQMGPECRFRVNKLIPNTKYDVIIKSMNKPGLTSWCHFITPKIRGSRDGFTFGVYGDTRDQYMYKWKYDIPMAINANNNPKEQLLIHLGDYAMTTRNCYNFAQNFFFWHHLALRNIAWVPVYGNHEFLSTYAGKCSHLPDAIATYPDFNQTVMREYLWDRNIKYYSYDYQNVHFLVMFKPYHDKESLNYYKVNSPQYNWVKDEVKKASDNPNIDFIIPVFHNPLISVSRVAPITDAYSVNLESVTFKPYHKLFKESKKVKVVFQACAHYLQHFRYDGIHYIINGGGGAPLTGGNNIYNRDLHGTSDGYLYCEYHTNFSYVQVGVGYNKNKPFLKICPIWAKRDGDKVVTKKIYETVVNITTQDAPGDSDVRITNVWTVPTHPPKGQSVKLYATIKNIGNAATPNNIKVGVGFTVDNVKNGYYFVRKSNELNTLASGETFTGISNVEWIAKSGNHSIKAIADDVNRFPEKNEDNNARVIIKIIN